MINANKLYSYQHLTDKQREIRQLAVNNLEAFIRLVAPYQLIAHCHRDLCKWIELHNDENKLLLWPRDHGKSRYAAFYTAWEIVRDPATTIIYASATAEKAEEQLRFIKSILASKICMKYFPELIVEDEGKRKAWNKTYIIIDHPERDMEGVVDSTVMTAGLEKTITGKHCKRLILDDIVVPENNNDTGRKTVNTWAAQAASIMSSDSSGLIVGTRYHPKDAYQIMMDMAYEVFDVDGESVGEAKSLFSVNMANVEQDGDFLFPRMQRNDGKWFGFNPEILAKKRAIYEANNEITQFFAQYYNDPNDKSTAPIARDLFKYYSKEATSYDYGTWSIDNNPLYVYAAIDLAATIRDTSDYTSFAVGGIDSLGNRYVLDLDRIRTDKSSPILTKTVALYEKFGFKALRIEAVGGFRLVAQDLAEQLYDLGIRIPIDLYVPPNKDAKIVRVNNILEPLYQSGSIYHYRGGHCQIMEEELVSVNPSHDDLKDAWSMCVDLMKTPRTKHRRSNKTATLYHPRFGGVAAA
jgi:hypothetical protein